MTEPKIAHPLVTPERRAKIGLIYPRQSSPAQVRDNTGSADVQLAQEQLARDMGFSRIEVITQDMGRSATTTHGRLGWQHVVNQIITGQVGALFAVNVSRLSRNLLDLVELLTLCANFGVLLIIDGRVLDPTDANDVSMTQVQGVFAQLDNAHRTKTMRDARYAKARRGDVVSRLPVGWIKRPDGTLDLDPEVRDTINDVRRIFWATGSLRQTVRKLADAESELPSRVQGQLVWKCATLDRVSHFLLHPAYAGFYIFGRTEMTFDPKKGRRVQQKLPRDRWIVHANHHPAYMTPEEQERIRQRVAQNDFAARHRPGRGRALCQGLVMCAHCDSRLTVADPGPEHLSHYYQCTQRASNLGERVCLTVQGRDVDAAVERTFLAMATAPPLETLLEALKDGEHSHDVRRKAIEAERQRLAHRERLAQERLQRIDPQYDLVFQDAVRDMQRTLEAKRDFERHVEEEEARAATSPTEAEIRELSACIASDVPALWRDPRVTALEKKEMLRSLIDHVIVDRTAEAVKLAIVWHGGEQVNVAVWRPKGVYRLILDRHTEGMTVPEIRDWLARGDPETGQRWSRTASGIYQALKRAGLRPHPVRRGHPVDAAAVQALYDRSVTLKEIAARLNTDGCRTTSGKPWTENIVWSCLDRTGRRAELEELHRRVLREVKERGLTNRQAAEELNARGIPRAGQRAWTAEAVRHRRTQLHRLERRRSHDANRRAAPEGSEWMGG